MGVLESIGGRVGLLMNGGVVRGIAGPPSEERLRAAVDGRVVLVTGASAGTGKAVARRLGAAGAKVLLVARRQERLEAIAEEIEDKGGAAFVHPADLSDVDAAAALGDLLLEQHGAVDVVVNNAGLSIRRSVGLSYDRFHDFDRTIRVNYLGPVRLLLTLLPAMRERGDGHIVNVSTIGVLFPDVPRYTAYLASKGAFDIWLRGLAPEVRGDGVACTSMYFGLIHTAMSGATSMYRYVPGLSPDQALVGHRVGDHPAPDDDGPAVGAARRAGRGRRARRDGARARSLLPRERGLRPRPRRARGGGARARDPRARPARPPRREGAAVNPLASAARGRRGDGDGVPALWRSGVLRPVDPRRLPAMARGALRSGPTFAAVLAIGAGRHPGRAAVIDEDGAISYAELADEVERVAGALHAEHGIEAEKTVGIQCRNHRGFVIALGAASRLGADVVLLNTDFSGRQLSEVLDREGVDLVLADAEFLPALDEHDVATPVVESRFAELRRAPDPAPRPRRSGRAVLLTSGTTGTPEGRRARTVVGGRRRAVHHDPGERAGARRRARSWSGHRCSTPSGSRSARSACRSG